jgi:hypothetical protein
MTCGAIGGMLPICAVMTGLPACAGPGRLCPTLRVRWKGVRTGVRIRIQLPLLVAHVF